MTTSTLRPQFKKALMRQLSQSPSREKNLLQKGFTLVELMIVIVIVGILSAIALPNFLSQTDKAKASEAKTQASAYLKQYYTAYMDGTTADVPCPAQSTNFSYDCTTAGSVTATGRANTSIAGKTFTASVNTTTGVITMPSGLSG
jgi:type IV pilus assembly protein PilA